MFPRLGHREHVVYTLWTPWRTITGHCTVRERTTLKRMTNRWIRIRLRYRNERFALLARRIAGTFNGNKRHFHSRSLMDPSNAVGLLGPADIDLADRCFPKPECDPSAKFRTINGGCNNLLFPVWGQANTANTRIIQADYSDGKIQSMCSVWTERVWVYIGTVRRF